MGRRFYCDYCDKSFPDSLVNRRAHLNGVQHKQARTLHFNNFIGPSEKLAQERSKKPCLSFQWKGVCDYGSTCRYSHMTNEVMQWLEDASKLETPSISFVSLNVEREVKKLEQVVRKRRQEATERALGLFKIAFPKSFATSTLPPSLNFRTCEESNTCK